MAKQKAGSQPDNSAPHRNVVLSGDGPQSANAAVVSPVAQTQGDGELSTSQRLFPNLTPAPVEPKVEEPNQGEPKPEVPEEPKPETPAEPKPQEPPKDEFDWDKFKSVKAKAKVDGQEREVTLEEMRKAFELKTHFDETAQKIGQERRALAEERRRLEEARGGIPTQQPPVAQPQPPVGDSLLSQDPLIQALLIQQQQQQMMMQQMMMQLQPTVHQNVRQRVDAELKKIGFNDFLSYIPKMEAYLATVQDDRLLQYYDSAEGGKQLYFMLKAQDLQQGQTQQPEPPKEPRVEPKKEPAIPKPQIPIPRIDGGNQGNPTVLDDFGAKKAKILERIRQNPDDREAVNELLRLQGIIK